jgi:hypothetical protein
MNRDDLILGFARLRAHGFDARAELLALASKLPSGQRAAFRRDVREITKLYADVRPTPKPQPKRPPAEDRKSKLTKHERAAWRRYAQDYPEQLASHMRIC